VYEKYECSLPSSAAGAVAAHFENPAVKVDPAVAADVLGRWELLEWGITEHLQEVTGGLHRSTAMSLPPGAPGVGSDGAAAVSAAGTGGNAAGGVGAGASHVRQAGRAAIAEGDIAPCEPGDAEAAGTISAFQAIIGAQMLPGSKDEEEPELESMQTPVVSSLDNSVPQHSAE
jgi:hypothetical protein